MTELADVDVLLPALDLLGTALAPSIRQRALSRMRGFCGWLVRRNHLGDQPVRRTRAHRQADIVW
jgi:site-specific recombinase XerC